MATDYYGVLGLRPGASDADIKRAYRKRARDLHPDVNPAPGAKDEFQEVSRAYEALTDPEKRRIIDLGGDPYETGRGAAGSPFGAGAGFGGLGDIMDAFFGGATARGPRSRTREGEDALIRVDLDLDETVFGTTTEITVDTAVLCDVCTGAGTAPGTHPETCTTCNGRGEVQSVQSSFLGQVIASRPCPAGPAMPPPPGPPGPATGRSIPTPCPQGPGGGGVRARRTIPVKIPAGVED